MHAFPCSSVPSALLLSPIYRLCTLLLAVQAVQLNLWNINQSFSVGRPTAFCAWIGYSCVHNTTLCFASILRNGQYAKDLLDPCLANLIFSYLRSLRHLEHAVSVDLFTNISHLVSSQQSLLPRGFSAPCKCILNSIKKIAHTFRLHAPFHGGIKMNRILYFYHPCFVTFSLLVYVSSFITIL
jgi:hypothetical protein